VSGEWGIGALEHWSVGAKTKMLHCSSAKTQRLSFLFYGRVKNFCPCALGSALSTGSAEGNNFKVTVLEINENWDD